MPPAPFDIAAALRRLVAIFWTQFGPIVLLGLALLTAPAMVAQALFADVSAGDGRTLVDTAVAVFGMIFLAAVNASVLITQKRPLMPWPAIRAATAIARPGVIAALVLSAAIMFAAIIRLLIGLAGVSAGLPGLIVFALLAWFLVAAFVAIPAAIVERHFPFPAIRRSFALTAGNRWRIAAFAAILLFALLPAAMLINSVIFGAAATPESAEAAIRSMTLASPGLWLGELFWLLACSLLAPAPAVVYLELTGS